MLGSKLIRNIVTLLTIAWWTAISCGPALADTVVLMNVPGSLGGDDDLNEAEQEFGGNHDPGFVVRNSDLEMGYERVEGYSDDPSEGSTPSRIALRYEDIDIPAGATITGAHIQFMADDEPDKTTFNPPPDEELGIPGTFAPLTASFSIYGYLNPTTPANAPPLPNNSLSILESTQYTLTDLSGGDCAIQNCANGTGPMGGVGSDIENVTDPVHWIDIPTWSTGDVDGDGTGEALDGEYAHIGGTRGPDQRTPDLSSIVQHIVDLPGWAPGNAMTFFIDPMVVGTDPETGDDIFARGSRVAVSMQCGPAPNRCMDIEALGITPTPPVLTIDFTIGTATPDGDYNEDGTVDAADYTVWRDGGSPDDSITGYNLWKANFGSSGSGSTAAVPEPSGLLLVVIACIASFVGHRLTDHHTDSRHPHREDFTATA
jgi:hypothetical protein